MDLTKGFERDLKDGHRQLVLSFFSCALMGFEACGGWESMGLLCSKVLEACEAVAWVLKSYITVCQVALATCHLAYDLMSSFLREKILNVPWVVAQYLHLCLP